MKKALLVLCLVACLVVAPVHAAHAEEDRKISLESGMDFNTGRYGGTKSTDILYVPVTAKYQDRTWTLKLTVPYLQITGPGNVVSLLNGVGLTGATGANTPVTRSGLGDVVIAATHNTYGGGAFGLFANLTGKVKFGTASRAKGLGTGENDYALQSDIYKITKQLTTFGTLGFKVYGKPPGAAYNVSNAFFGSLGGSYRFSQETSAGLMLSLAQKTIVTGSSHVEAILFASQKLDRNWKARGYAMKGFTKSVPSWGAGATVAYLF